MSTHSVERYLPYTPEQLFDLVADVERYPEFVPWWISATVWKRYDNVYYTRQVLGLPFLHLEFQTRTTLNRPKHIHVSSVDRHFRTLDMRWDFTQLHERRTQICLQVDFEFCATYLTLLDSFISIEGIRRLIDVFEDRALQLSTSSHDLLTSSHHYGPAENIASEQANSLQHRSAHLVHTTSQTRPRIYIN